MLATSDRYTITELCEEFWISRKSGHKWLSRYAVLGKAGLLDQSRSPKIVHNRTRSEVERLIIKEKRLHMTWGPKKLQRELETKHSIESLLAVSTVGEVLKRHGLVKARSRKAGVFKVERGNLTAPEHSNHVFGIDFKGWFMTQDGERFDPLTVSDLHSRYILKAEGLKQATRHWTQRAFRNMFRTYGLPEIIRVDNGTPFALCGRSSSLSFRSITIFWTMTLRSFMKQSSGRGGSLSALHFWPYWWPASGCSASPLLWHSSASKKSASAKCWARPRPVLSGCSPKIL